MFLDCRSWRSAALEPAASGQLVVIYLPTCLNAFSGLWPGVNQHDQTTDTEKTVTPEQSSPPGERID